MLSLADGELGRAVGITTTIPMEVVFAAGLRPLDLNNAFITSGEAPDLVEAAERAGFPRNSCSWAKGCYAAALRLGLRRVIAVTEGDCSLTHALMEMLSAQGVEVTPFAFPFRGDRQLLALHMERFASELGTTVPDAETWRERLDPVRALAHEIDAMCWHDGKVTSEEAHGWLISCSDFCGDPASFERNARAFVEQARTREPACAAHRVAVAGIPPICDDFYAFLESLGVRIVFHEVPRQFGMPAGGDSLVEQYARYTYPYPIFGRLEDIAEQCRARRIDGVIHYVQSFCFRQVQDVLLRRRLDLPVLTLECDRPGPLDARSRTRVEAFCEMLPDAPRQGEER